MTESNTPLLEATPTAQTLEVHSYRHRRISEDMYQRALVGAYFYVIACLLIMAITDYHVRWPWPAALLLAAYVLLWWLRYQHHPPTRGAQAAQYTQWFRQQWLLVQIGTFMWGLVPALVGWVQRKPDSSVLVVTVVTVAFATAASHTLAMHPTHARIAIFSLLFPAVAVFALPMVELWSTSVTLFIYAFYLMANLRRNANEYVQQINTEIDLISSRAEVSRLSLLDTLTTLPNRLSYEQAWPQAWHAAARKREPLVLFVLDIDHFKRINDKYGHLAGDACLRHFADILRQHVRRDSDSIARIGGEEFVVILPATLPEFAYTMAEQFRASLGATPCRFEDVAIAMTVSIGMGAVDWDADTNPSATFNRIDHACYEAKNDGRNRVKVAKLPLAPDKT